MDADAHRGREALCLPLIGEPALDRDRGVDRAIRVVEGQEEAVACGLDLLAPVLGDDRPKRLVVPAEEPLPALVAEKLGESRRVNDVGEDECLRDSLA